MENTHFDQSWLFFLFHQKLDRRHLLIDAARNKKFFLPKAEEKKRPGEGGKERV